MNVISTSSQLEAGSPNAQLHKTQFFRHHVPLQNDKVPKNRFFYFFQITPKHAKRPEKKQDDIEMIANCKSRCIPIEE